MIILSISKLNNNQWAGVNINIPKYVKYLQEHVISGYLNCSDLMLDAFDGYDNYFTIKDLKNFDISSLPKPFNKPDIVVFQQLYEISFIKIAKNLRNDNIPYIIIPRCSLTAKAQQKSYIKKKIANFLLFNEFIENAKCIHFLTKNEYMESKDLFNIKEHVIVGNGIEMPSKKYVSKKREEFKVIFIGRYDLYHKGLDVLLEAINEKKDYFKENNIKFVLFGKNYGKTLNYMKRYIYQNNISEIVELNDPILGKNKQEVLLDADVFVHTSRLEGHPTSVIEAISYGIPVIVTPGTNVAEDVEENELGYTCELNAKSIASTIIKAYENKEKFDQISNNEVEYAKKEFDWKKITIKMLEKYERVIGLERG